MVTVVVILSVILSQTQTWHQMCDKGEPSPSSKKKVVGEKQAQSMDLLLVVFALL